MRRGRCALEVVKTMLFPLFFFGGTMDLLIARLESLNVPDAVEIVADCIDFGRLPILVDYMSARERLYDMEVETYVR